MAGAAVCGSGSQRCKRSRLQAGDVPHGAGCRCDDTITISPDVRRPPVHTEPHPRHHGLACCARDHHYHDHQGL